MPKDKRATGWLLDEVASAGRENLDPVHVWRYDQKEDARAGDELVVLTEFGLSGDSVVVDLGAGTGQFAIAAARVCGRVVAVEVSPVMLEVLMRRVDEERVSNVEIVRSGFLTYEHEGPLADFAYSRYALHHLPDFWKGVALDRIRRILRPGGVFRLWDVVYSFEPEAAAERIEAWCATGTRDADADWTAGRARRTREGGKFHVFVAARANDPTMRLPDRRDRLLRGWDVREVRPQIDLIVIALPGQGSSCRYALRTQTYSCVDRRPDSPGNRHRHSIIGDRPDRTAPNYP